MIRRSGLLWYAIGIAGTIVFMAIWIITRMPGNPITGRAGPAGNPIAIAVEVFQAAFIGLSAAIIVYEYREKKRPQHGEKSTASEKAKAKYGSKGRLPILAGIVIALILIGFFALPPLMPSPPGAGQFGALQGQLPSQQNASRPTGST